MQITAAGQGIGRASALAMARERAALFPQGSCEKVSLIAENTSTYDPKILLVQRPCRTRASAALYRAYSEGVYFNTAPSAFQLHFAS